MNQTKKKQNTSTKKEKKECFSQVISARKAVRTWCMNDCVQFQRQSVSYLQFHKSTFIIIHVEQYCTWVFCSCFHKAMLTQYVAMCTSQFSTHVLWWFWEVNQANENKSRHRINDVWLRTDESDWLWSRENVCREIFHFFRFFDFRSDVQLCMKDQTERVSQERFFELGWTKARL